MSLPWVLTVTLLQHLLGVLEEVDERRVGLHHVGRVAQHEAADAHLLAPVRLRVVELLQHTPINQYYLRIQFMVNELY